MTFIFRLQHFQSVPLSHSHYPDPDFVTKHHHRMDQREDRNTAARPRLTRKLEAAEFEDQNLGGRQLLAVEGQSNDSTVCHFSPTTTSQTAIPLPDYPHSPSGSLSIAPPPMDHHGGKTTTATRSLKRKLDPESEDQHEERKVLVVEHRNKDVESNSTTRSTSFSTAAQIPPSTSRPCSNRWNYDVFLSFRGEDTRKSFTDHLYSALVKAGIRTFRDDDELRRGENISTELLNAIRGSRISIAVFSKGYASSRWCLDELVEILHCTKTRGQTLLPVFYDANPSDVRKQTGTFAQAFARHEERFQEDMERVQRWRIALTEAADLSGWDLESVANGYESRFIEEIIEEVLSKVNFGRLPIATHPIGIDSRVEEVKYLLNLRTTDVCMVGIYGMGGIGKTTLAKALYNQICDEFEGSSCLLNIKEVSGHLNGLVQLQEQLLYDILKMKNVKIHNAEEGIKVIEKRIQGKRVLMVLDDVDHLRQLQALVGNCQWLSPESRVIVTTRDEHVLTQLGVHEKYKVTELNHLESLRLFCWHAFKMAHPKEGYQELSIRAVEYTRGLPLALEVLGSFLLGRSVEAWEDELEKVHKIPHMEIHKVLWLSFKSLDHHTKKIFLDIACFFLSMDKEYVIRILHGCDFFPNIGISVLIQRSLLTIDVRKKLRMHDPIRDMGREIVRKRSPNNLGRRSRLWFYEDVLNVLSNHSGSEAVEGLTLTLPVPEGVHLETKAFAKLKNLRLLEINDTPLIGSYKHFSKELKWLCWHKFPLEFLPQNLHLDNLVVLDMQHSNLKQLWKENRILNKLKILNLSYSKNLTKSPCFLHFPHLEILTLEGCTSLVELHESIELLKRLVELNLQECKNLRNLPRTISNLKSLESINLCGCLKLDELPEKAWNMMAFNGLLTVRTTVKQLPSSIGLFKDRQLGVSMSKCERPSSESWLSRFSSWMSRALLQASGPGFRSLGSLVLNNCNLAEDGVAIDLRSLSSLQHLDLSQNDFRNLPNFVSHIPRLQRLILMGCASLNSISELPASMKAIYVVDCSSMERLSLPSSSQPVYVSLYYCSNLVEIEGLNLQSSLALHLYGCNNLSSDFRTSLLQYSSTQAGPCYLLNIVPGSEIPNWFSCQTIGSSLSFHVPSLSGHKNGIFVICAVVAFKKEPQEVWTEFRLVFHNKTRGYRQDFLVAAGYYFVADETDHLVLMKGLVKGNEVVLLGALEGFVGLKMISGEEIEMSFEVSGSAEVKRCGVHLEIDEPDVKDKVSEVDAAADSVVFEGED